MKDQPLKIEVADGRLVLSIGVDTLAHSNKIRSGQTVTNAEGFAKDVATEIRAEEEDGSTVLTDMLDDAMDSAMNNGSEHTNWEEALKTR